MDRKKIVRITRPPFRDTSLKSTRDGRPARTIEKKPANIRNKHPQWWKSMYIGRIKGGLIRETPELIDRSQSPDAREPKEPPVSTNAHHVMYIPFATRDRPSDEPIIPVRIDKTNLRAYCDTGANCDVITAQILDEVHPTWKSKLRKSSATLFAANNTPINHVGTIRVTLTFPNPRHQITVNAYVTEQCDGENVVILGYPSMVKHNLIPIPGHGLMQMKGKSTQNQIAQSVFSIKAMTTSQAPDPNQPSVAMWEAHPTRAAIVPAFHKTIIKIRPKADQKMINDRNGSKMIIRTCPCFLEGMECDTCIDPDASDVKTGYLCNGDIEVNYDNTRSSTAASVSEKDLFYVTFEKIFPLRSLAETALNNVGRMEFEVDIPTNPYTEEECKSLFQASKEQITDQLRAIVAEPESWSLAGRRPATLRLINHKGEQVDQNRPTEKPIPFNEYPNLNPCKVCSEYKERRCNVERLDCEMRKYHRHRGLPQNPTCTLIETGVEFKTHMLDPTKPQAVIGCHRDVNNHRRNWATWFRRPIGKIAPYLATLHDAPVTEVSKINLISISEDMAKKGITEVHMTNYKGFAISKNLITRCFPPNTTITLYESDDTQLSKPGTAPKTRPAMAPKQLHPTPEATLNITKRGTQPENVVSIEPGLPSPVTPLDAAAKGKEAEILTNDPQLKKDCLDMLEAHKEVFATSDNDCGTFIDPTTGKPYYFKIRLKDTSPVMQKTRFVAPSREEAATALVAALIENDIIQRQHSPYNSQSVFVQKKPKLLTKDEYLKRGGRIENFIAGQPDPMAPIALRHCCDFVELNNKIEDAATATMSPKAIITKLAGQKSCATLDVSGAYHAMVISPEDRIVTGHDSGCPKISGRLTYKRSVMGLKSSSTWLSAALSKTLAPAMGYYLLFADDILVYGKDDRQVLERLTCVIDLLRRHGWKLKRNKLVCFTKKLNVLGQQVSLEDQTIAAPRAALDAILERPRPGTKLELKSFLGSVNWFGTHLPSHGQHSATLNRICRKDSDFKWDEPQLEAYEALLDLFAHPQIHNSFPDYEKPFHIIADTSTWSTGFLLCQSNMEGTPNPTIMNDHEGGDGKDMGTQPTTLNPANTPTSPSPGGDDERPTGTQTTLNPANTPTSPSPGGDDEEPTGTQTIPNPADAPEGPSAGGDDKEPSGTQPPTKRTNASFSLSPDKDAFENAIPGSIKVISYHTHVHDERTARLSPHERESHGMILALATFFDLIAGCDVTLHTDSKVSTLITAFSKSSSKVSRWATLLNSFHWLKINWLSSKSKMLQLADWLSRPEAGHKEWRNKAITESDIKAIDHVASKLKRNSAMTIRNHEYLMDWVCNLPEKELSDIKDYSLYINDEGEIIHETATDISGAPDPEANDRVAPPPKQNSRHKGRARHPTPQHDEEDMANRRVKPDEMVNPAGAANNRHTTFRTKKAPDTAADHCGEALPSETKNTTERQAPPPIYTRQPVKPEENPKLTHKNREWENEPEGTPRGRGSLDARESTTQVTRVSRVKAKEADEAGNRTTMQRIKSDNGSRAETPFADSVILTFEEADSMGLLSPASQNIEGPHWDPPLTQYPEPDEGDTEGAFLKMCFDRSPHMKLHTLVTAQEGDPLLARLRKKCESGPLTYDTATYMLHTNILIRKYHKNGIVTMQLCLPKQAGYNLALKAHIGSGRGAWNHHTGGSIHAGPKKLHAMLSQRFHFEGMRKICQEIHNGCGICTETKDNPCKKRADATRSIIRVDSPAMCWAVDELKLPPEHGMKSGNVLVAVDLYSRFTIVMPVDGPSTSENLLQLMQWNLVMVHGRPRTIICDNNANLAGSAMQQACASLNITLRTTPIYSPRSNITENANKYILKSLRIYHKNHQIPYSRWRYTIPIVVSAMNYSTFSGRLGTQYGLSPVKIFYGNSRGKLDPALNFDLPYLEHVYQTHHEFVKHMTESAWVNTQIISEHRMREMNERAAASGHPHDRFAQHKTFQTGDLVILDRHQVPGTIGKLRPRAQYRFVVLYETETSVFCRSWSPPSIETFCKAQKYTRQNKNAILKLPILKLPKELVRKDRTLALWTSRSRTEDKQLLQDAQQEDPEIMELEVDSYPDSDWIDILRMDPEDNEPQAEEIPEVQDEPIADHLEYEEQLERTENPPEEAPGSEHPTLEGDPDMDARHPSREEDPNAAPETRNNQHDAPEDGSTTKHPTPARLTPVFIPDQRADEIVDIRDRTQAQANIKATSGLESRTRPKRQPRTILKDPNQSLRRSGRLRKRVGFENTAQYSDGTQTPLKPSTDKHVRRTFEFPTPPEGSAEQVDQQTLGHFHMVPSRDKEKIMHIKPEHIYNRTCMCKLCPIQVSRCRQHPCELCVRVGPENRQDAGRAASAQ